MVKRILAAVAALLVLCAAAQGEDCRLKRRAALDLSFGSGGRPVVTIQVNGHPFRFLVDTGSDHTMLTEDAAKTLGLSFEAFPNSVGYLWGGEQLKALVHADTLQIDRLLLAHSTLYVLPKGRLAPSEDGLLGTDIMARFDADFDFGGRKLNLVEHSPCPGKAVYWTDEKAAAQIPFRKQTTDVPITGITINKLNVVVTLDGAEVLAILDTGAPGTSLDFDTAQQAFDLKPDSPGMVKLMRPEGSYSYTFKTLSFGSVEIANPNVRLDPYAVHQMWTRGPKMLIGMNVLSRFHLYIAYQERMLYVTSAAAH